MDERPLPLVLTVNLKETLPVEFSLQLKRYIRDEYHEEPDSYTDEIRGLERLRMSASAPSRDYSGCTLLRRYYAQLQFLQSRFPMLEGGAAAVSFSWTDALTEKSSTCADIRHEQASVLFNLGALHSQLAEHDSRRTEEGIRVACTHFQCAAGAFDHMKDHYPETSTTDTTSEVLVLFTSIMLGQAQECLLDKSLKDRRNSGLVAKISLQIAEYFQTTLDMLAIPNLASALGSKRLKSWTKTLTAKTAYYGGLARFFMSEHCEDNRKYGEKVAWLQVASERMAEALKQVKSGDDTTRDAVKYAAEVISKRLDKSKKDNQKVYHELVPKPDTLPAIVGVTLVKAMPLSLTDPSVAGIDIFAKLVPFHAHEKASMYSEEKAKLLRTIRDEIEAHDADLNRFMHSLDLDEVVGKKLGGRSQRAAVPLPDDVRRMAAEIRSRARDVASIEKSVQDVEELSTRVQENLEHIRRTVEEEERLGSEFARDFDVKPTPTAVTQLEEMKKQLEADQKVFEKGSSASTNLVEMYSTHRDALRLLSSPPNQLTAALPVVSTANLPIDEEVVRRLREVSGKVDEMKQQRETLWQKLKEQMNKDDITQKIVVHETGNEALFAKELQKHDDTLAVIRQNLEAQKNITLALTEANARYATTRQALAEKDTALNEVLNSLRSAHGEFEQLLLRGSQGVMFFRQLDTRQTKLRRKVHEYCQLRRRERLPYRKEEEPSGNNLSAGGAAPPSSQARQDHAPPPGLMPSRASKPPPGLMPSRLSKPPHLSAGGISTGGRQQIMPSLSVGHEQSTVSPGIATGPQPGAPTVHALPQSSLQDTSSTASQLLPPQSELDSVSLQHLRLQQPQVHLHPQLPGNLQQVHHPGAQRLPPNPPQPVHLPGPAVPPAIAALAGRTGRTSSSPELTHAHLSLPLDDPAAAVEKNVPSPSTVEALISLLPTEVLEALPAEVLVDPNNFNLLAELVNVGTAVSSEHPPVDSSAKTPSADSHVASTVVAPDSSAVARLVSGEVNLPDRPELSLASDRDKESADGLSAPDVSASAQVGVTDEKQGAQSSGGDHTRTLGSDAAAALSVMHHSALDQLTAAESCNAQEKTGKSVNDQPTSTVSEATNSHPAELSDASSATLPENVSSDKAAAAQPSDDNKLSSQSEPSSQSTINESSAHDALAVPPSDAGGEKTADLNVPSDPTTSPDESAKPNTEEMVNSCRSSESTSAEANADQAALTDQVNETSQQKVSVVSCSTSSVAPSDLSISASSESNLSVHNESDLSASSENKIAAIADSGTVVQEMPELRKEGQAQDSNTNDAGKEEENSSSVSSQTLSPPVDASDSSAQVAGGHSNNGGECSGELQILTGVDDGGSGTATSALSETGVTFAAEATSAVQGENSGNGTSQVFSVHTGDLDQESHDLIAGAKKDSVGETIEPSDLISTDNVKDKGGAEKGDEKTTTDVSKAELQVKKEDVKQVGGAGPFSTGVYPSLTTATLLPPTETKPKMTMPSSSCADATTKSSDLPAPASHGSGIVNTVSQGLNTATSTNTVTSAAASTTVLYNQNISTPASQPSSLSPAHLELIAKLKEKTAQPAGSQNAADLHMPISKQEESDAHLSTSTSPDVQVLLTSQRTQIAVQEQQMKSQAAAIAVLQSQIREHRQAEDRLRQRHQETIIANQQLQLAQQQNQLQVLIHQQQQEQKEKRERLQAAASILQQRQQQAEGRQRQVQQLLLQQKQSRQLHEMRQSVAGVNPLVQSVRTVVSSQIGNPPTVPTTVSQLYEQQPLTQQEPLNAKPGEHVHPVLQASQRPAIKPLQSVYQHQAVNQQLPKPVSEQPLQSQQLGNQQQPTQALTSQPVPPVHQLDHQLFHPVTQQSEHRNHPTPLAVTEHSLHSISQLSLQPIKQASPQPTNQLLPHFGHQLHPDSQHPPQLSSQQELQLVGQQAGQLASHQSLQPVSQQSVQPVNVSQQSVQPVGVSQQPLQSASVSQQPLQPVSQQPLQPVNISQQSLQSASVSQQPLQPVSQQPLQPVSISQQSLQPVSQQQLEPIGEQPLHFVSQQPFRPTCEDTLQPASQQPLQAARQPLQPASQQPFQLASQQPFQLASQQPLQLASQQPLQPASQQPLQPASQQPLQAARQPLQPASKQPLQPTSQQQLQPASQQPLQPTSQQPLQPLSQQPQQPLSQQPLQPASQQLLQPVGQQPLQPSGQQPLHPGGQQLLQPASQQPLQPASQQPLQPTSQQPLQAASQQPFQPASQQPFQPVSQKSLQPVSQQPSCTSQQVMQPVGQQTLRPVYQQPVQPANQQSLQNVGQQTGQPVNRENPQPFIQHLTQQGSQQPSVQATAVGQQSLQVTNQQFLQSINQQPLQPVGHQSPQGLSQQTVHLSQAPLHAVIHQPVQNISQQPLQPGSRNPVSFQPSAHQPTLVGRQPLQVSQEVQQQNTQQPLQSGDQHLHQPVSLPPQPQSLRQEQFTQTDRQQQWQQRPSSPQHRITRSQQPVGPHQLGHQVLSASQQTSFPSVKESQTPASSQKHLPSQPHNQPISHLYGQQLHTGSYSAQFQPGVHNAPHSVQSQSSGATALPPVFASTGRQMVPASYSQKLPLAYSEGQVPQTAQQMTSLRPQVQGPAGQQPTQPISLQHSSLEAGIPLLSSSLQQPHCSTQSLPSPLHYSHVQPQQQTFRSQSLHGGYVQRMPLSAVSQQQPIYQRTTQQQQNTPHPPHTQAYHP